MPCPCPCAAAGVVVAAGAAFGAPAGVGSGFFGAAPPQPKQAATTIVNTIFFMKRTPQCKRICQTSRRVRSQRTT